MLMKSRILFVAAMVFQLMCVVAISASEPQEEPVKPLAELIQQLHAEDAAVRLSAVRDIEDMGFAARDAIPELIHLFAKEQDQDARWWIISALSSIVTNHYDPDADFVADLPAEQMQQLLEVCLVGVDDTGQYVRHACVWLLRYTPMTSADKQPHMAKWLDHADPNVRVGALGFFSDHPSNHFAVIPKLVRFFDDPDNFVRHMALEALQNATNDPQVLLPWVMKLLDDPDSFVYEQAFDVLGEMDLEEDQVIAILIRKWEHENASVRESVRKTWRWVAKRSRVESPQLLKQLHEQDLIRRIWAANVLAMRHEHEEQVWATLSPLMRNESSLIVAIAAATPYGLENPSPAAVEALTDIVASDNAAARAGALDVIQQAGPAAAASAPALLTALGDPAPQLRAAAAAALSQIARQFEGNPKHYSDLPQDNSTTSNLSDETLHDIAAALGRACEDDDRNVRNEAIRALAWLGKKMAPATSALLGRLDDPDDYLRMSAYQTLSYLGTQGKEVEQAVAVLRQRWANMGDNREERNKIIVLLRSLGAYDKELLDDLLQQLHEQERASFASWELVQWGEAALPRVIEKSRDADPEVRGRALDTLGEMGKTGLPVREVLLAAVNDPVDKVQWLAIEAAAKIGVEPEVMLPLIIPWLQRNNEQDVRNAAKLLDLYDGKQTLAARPLLIEALKKDLGDNANFYVSRALQNIGLDQSAAEAVLEIPLRLDSRFDLLRNLFVAMIETPDAALRFLQRYPQVFDQMDSDEDTLIDVIEHTEPEFAALREFVLQHEQLPSWMMAWSGDPRFLPIFHQRMEKASAYERIDLQACARACGEPADRIVHISEQSTGNFKPDSAYPQRGRSHGDGIMKVLITGRIVMADGTPAVNPRLFRTNDSFLMGERRHDPQRIKYDPKTGRFVTIVNVFAAFTRDDRPYETGSALLQLEADGAKSLQVRFYDEMPDVLITMTPGE